MLQTAAFQWVLFPLGIAKLNWVLQVEVPCTGLISIQVTHPLENVFCLNLPFWCMNFKWRACNMFITLRLFQQP